jgi:glycerate dehydrogenase
MTPELRVVFLDARTFDRGDVCFDRFTRRWPCAFHPHSTREETPPRLAGVQVAVANKSPLDAGILESPEARDLRLIAVAATGANNIDLDAARRHGVAVCNVKGYSAPSVAQHAFAMLLELATHAGRLSEDVKRGAWERSPIFTLLTYPAVELAGRTIGIVGFGDIGRQVARIAEGFGMKVRVAARKGQAPAPGRTALDDLLRQADVVTLHCPLTPETERLIGARELGLMKPGAFLLNASRGGLVDEAALIRALDEGRLAGAGFDVLTREPPPADHVLLEAARRRDNLILTPHSAWSAKEARERLLAEVFENIAAFEAGRERNRVV